MPEPTVEELREWSARKLMGWIVKNDYCPNYRPCWIKNDTNGRGYTVIMPEENWKPDEKESGQIWLCVGKMREKGLLLELIQWKHYYGARFGDKKLTVFIADENPCFATLKAAKAAREGK